MPHDERLAHLARDEVRREWRDLLATIDLTRGEDWRQRRAAIKAKAVRLGIDLPAPFLVNVPELRAALAARPELAAAVRPALARRRMELGAIRRNMARAHCLRARRAHTAPRAVRARRASRSTRTRRARAPAGPREDPEPRRRFPRDRSGA